jgi:hypothetical protein
VIQGSRVIPQDQHRGPNQNAENKPGGKPEADLIADPALGKIKKAGRFIFVHSG